jgi:hypothetical protein
VFISYDINKKWKMSFGSVRVCGSGSLMQAPIELVKYKLGLVGVQVRCCAVREVLYQQGMMLFCVGKKKLETIEEWFLCIEV